MSIRRLFRVAISRVATSRTSTKVIGVTLVGTIGLLTYYQLKSQPQRAVVHDRRTPGRLSLPTWDLKRKLLPTKSNVVDLFDHPHGPGTYGSFAQLEREQLEAKLPVVRSRWSLQSEGIWVHAEKGRRPSMEDRFAFARHDSYALYALYDGHGGELTVNDAEGELTAKLDNGLSSQLDLLDDQAGLSKFLTTEIQDFDKQLLPKINSLSDNSGSTAIIAIRHGKNRLTVGNVGDSRGVLGFADGQASPVSVDHKPNRPDELQRIKDAGGMVVMYGVWRVQGILAISRALGDQFLKIPKEYVIAEPEILTFTTDGAKFLILASDGLWDVFENQEAVSFILERWNEKMHGTDELVRAAIAKGSMDNVTVMVIEL